MKTISALLLFFALFSCDNNELPEPSMEKELQVGDFVLFDTIGDSLILHSNNRINIIQGKNDSNFLNNGTKYKEFLNARVED